MMASSAKHLFSLPQMRWAIGGWSFFIIENFVLSENRTWIIDEVGDSNYHAIYGTFSSIAMVSVGYGYHKIRDSAPYFAASTMTPLRYVSFISYCIGLGLVSQTLPKLQVPVTRELDTSSELKKSDILSDAGWKVQCPFDFTSSDNSVQGPKGVERISRHPGLWGFGLVCLGAAAKTPSIPQASWFCMPIMVALIGGHHTDSRYRRGMGGHLTAELDEQTSNVPFAAILTSVLSGNISPIKASIDESKGINLMLACGLAASLTLRGKNVRKILR